MRHRLSLVLTLAAWLLATGSHWDLVQTFAWGRMIASYSQSMSLGSAVRMTFTPENMCGVCDAVAEGKQQQDASSAPTGKIDTKVLLAYQPVAMIALVIPDERPWATMDLPIAGEQRAQPPIPPPRVLA